MEQKWQRTEKWKTVMVTNKKIEYKNSNKQKNGTKNGNEHINWKIKRQRTEKWQQNCNEQKNGTQKWQWRRKPNPKE